MAKLTLSLSILILACNLCIAQECLPGCQTCYQQGPTTLCSACKTGFYKTLITETCVRCLVKCSLCSSDQVCSACSSGYFLEGSSCKPCIANCDECTNATTCSFCMVGSTRISDTECRSGENSGTPEPAKQSLTGQIIGYCISGVVFVFCCVIGILYQKKKMEDEEEGRKKFKEEMRQKRIDRGEAVSDMGAEDEEGAVESPHREREEQAGRHSGEQGFRNKIEDIGERSQPVDLDSARNSSQRFGFGKPAKIKRAVVS